jgi:UPF0755 protein
MISRVARLVVVGFVAACAVLFLAAIYVDQPEAGASVSVVVSEGATAKNVAHMLEEKGLVSSSFGYRLYGWFSATARRPKAGSYEFSRGLGYRTIAKALALGPARNEIQVRIIEGWTVDDLVAYLKTEQGLEEEATRRLIGSSADRRGLDPAWKKDFAFLESLSANRSLEGYLFPDTYRVWQDQLPEGLVRKQLEEFASRYDEVKVGAESAPLKHLDEVVRLASIVEKEVRDPEDRKIVAGIFLRRLQLGMALQSDATLNYVLGSGRSRASATDLETESPYNSYKHTGLPPGPISNPGATAMDAVLHPTKTNYLYFLTDAEGNVLYARTFEEHVANRRRAGY